MGLCCENFRPNRRGAIRYGRIARSELVLRTTVHAACGIERQAQGFEGGNRDFGSDVTSGKGREAER